LLAVGASLTGVMVNVACAVALFGSAAHWWCRCPAPCSRTRPDRCSWRSGELDTAADDGDAAAGGVVTLVTVRVWVLSSVAVAGPVASLPVSAAKLITWVPASSRMVGRSRSGRSGASFTSVTVIAMVPAGLVPCGPSVGPSLIATATLVVPLKSVAGTNFTVASAVVTAAGAPVMV